MDVNAATAVTLTTDWAHLVNTHWVSLVFMHLYII